MGSVPATPTLYTHFPPTPTPRSATGTGGSVFAQQQMSVLPSARPPSRGASKQATRAAGVQMGVWVLGRRMIDAPRRGPEHWIIDVASLGVACVFWAGLIK
ncbi:hypothetical protein BD309DRAFT_1028909 [Dichomitus squalens]|nr:hypothetical protein BD309DRAFT_1028909 [Dichomitus squalens]